MNSITLVRNKQTLHLETAQQKRGQKRLSYRLIPQDMTIQRLVRFFGTKSALSILSSKLHATLDHMIHYDHSPIEEVIQRMNKDKSVEKTKAELADELQDAILKGDIKLAQQIQRDMQSKSRIRLGSDGKETPSVKRALAASKLNK